MAQQDEAAASEDERREAEAARREAEALRRDREKADAAAAKEAARLDREREKAERQRTRDAENAQREREKAARDAAKEAGRAHREAAKAQRSAALAEQRANREAERALAQARRAEGPDDGAELRADLPPDLAVLWRRPAAPRRGPRPGLTVEQIADAAIQLADDEGLDAVSMARLAESLGFTTMSLYRYVASKDDVLMLMSDRAAGVPVPSGPEVGDWRARLEVLLEQMRPILASHPWMSRTTNLLFAVGPNRLAWMEALVDALDGTPLTETQKLQAAGALSSHQLEWARLVEADQSRRRALARTRGGSEPTGEDDPNAVIVRLVTPDEHPALMRAVAAGVFDATGPGGGQEAEALDFGTTLILDGIARLVEGAEG
ncbi:TetR/AcrR family transcriptional regulator [Cellulomonas alba]|uniref:TetR family transcriptional regulator n=1 Tax=Cellulomonas alba TaxID=3053467 RepID=A0ABT7SGF5_9CELL|nr:TetR family transcriptional regulator [Cellulomonas alba]MDM7855124.1 TetR family transcriptional regulator [Cellulomonas alba]